MQADLFIRGFFIGLSIAVPVGPIGLLCIRRTISDGRLRGLVTGLGTAMGDATYGGVAAFGLTVVSSFLVRYSMWFRLFGGVFLVYLGAMAFESRPVEKTDDVKDAGVLGVFASTYLLTLTNPLTILMFTAVFAGFGVAPTALVDAAAVTLFIFLGSAGWWIVLTLLVGLFRRFFDARMFRVVNIVSGLLIAGFGLYSIIVTL